MTCVNGCNTDTHHTSRMASKIRSTAGCHHTCQAEPNLFEPTEYHLLQRQCNMECLMGPFWGLSCFCYTSPIWTRSSLTTAYVALLCWWLTAVSILSSGSNPTAADRHDRVHYGHRLMNEVEQAAIESCKDRISMACNTASTSLFQRQFFHPWQYHHQAYHHHKKSRGDDESGLLNEVPHQ